MTTPEAHVVANLNALAAKARQLNPPPKEKPLPCTTWCSMEALTAGRTTNYGAFCTCKEPCLWEQCPMDVEAYAPPAVPLFRRQAEIREGAINEIAEALREQEAA